MTSASASNAGYIQAVEPRMHPLRHPFTPKQPNPLDLLLQDRLHSPQVIRTIDILTLADESEFMRSYVVGNDEAYRLFIQLMGQHFERSPNQRKTQIPLMLLTNTESIFARRIRRLKHIQKQSFSSRMSSGTDISFSKSYIPNNNSGRYLESRLSQKNLSDITEFKVSKYYPIDQHDIFCPSSDEDPEQEIKWIRKKSEGQFNQWLALSGIRRLGPMEEKDTALVTAIRQPKEEEMYHLIVGCPSIISAHALSPQMSRRASRKQDKDKVSSNRGEASSCGTREGDCRSGLKRVREHLVSPLGYLVDKDLPLRLKKEVYRELSKYSWEGVGPTSAHLLPRKRVKDKAMALLQEMGHQIDLPN